MYTANYITLVNPNTSEQYNVQLCGYRKDGKNKDIWTGTIDGIRQSFYAADGWRKMSDKPTKREGGKYAITTAATVNRREGQRQANYSMALATGLA